MLEVRHNLVKATNNLKVIAFKLPEEQISNIKGLCSEGFYPSLSETVRIAITDYISYILDYTNLNETEFWLTPMDQKNLSDYNNNKTSKISACTKMPIELLNTIDTLISKNNQFMNRTNFIRLAVHKFLENDSQIYSYWLNKQIKNSFPTTNHVVI